MENTRRSIEDRTLNRAAAGHVAPFVIWIAFIIALQVPESLGFALPPLWHPVAYAAKSAICAALLLWLKPWRCHRGAWRPARRAADIATGILAGLFVAAFWMIPELPQVFARFPGAAIFYRKWLVMPLGGFPEYFAPQIFPSLPENCAALAYSPSRAGWFLAIARLAGSSFVIAAAEEFFFRGFLYRWIRNRNWRDVPLKLYDAQSFWIVCALFALEHDRWLAGLLAGVVFGALTLRTGNLRAAICAHMTANFTIGAYVLASGQYGFW